jgi:hypothetical protein
MRSETQMRIETSRRASTSGSASARLGSHLYADALRGLTFEAGQSWSLSCHSASARLRIPQIPNALLDIDALQMQTQMQMQMRSENLDALRDGFDK